MRHPTLRHLLEWENGDSDSRPIIHALQKGRDNLDMPTQGQISLHKTSESPAMNAFIKTYHMLGVLGVSYIHSWQKRLLHPHWRQ